MQLDVTVVTVALPRLGRELPAGMAGLQWIVDGYALPFSATLLLGGFGGDRLGAGRVFGIGVVVFGLASAGCGLAPDLFALVAARVLQGLGAALMLPCALSLVNHATQHDRDLRARALALWTAAGSIGLASGPVLGGVLLGAGSWRWIFLLNLPVCALAWFFARRAPETPREEEGQGLDPFGQLLAVLALGGLVGGVIESHARGIGDPVVSALLATGVAALPLFVLVEMRQAAPLLPPALFRSRVFSVSMLYGAASSVSYYGVLFVLSLYFQHVRGFGALGTGLAFLPLTATFTVVNLVSASLVARWGARTCMVGGFALDAAGFALLAELGPHSPYWAAVPAFVLIPAGMGTGIPAMLGVMLGSAPRERSGVASAGVLAATAVAAAVIVPRERDPGERGCDGPQQPDGSSCNRSSP
ncbi:MAG: MFS transporter [Gluconacetobacter diazotrophicus]|nr:MFS transporter [Gluconacetobacter diazotrophicus]